MGCPQQAVAQREGASSSGGLAAQPGGFAALNGLDMRPEQHEAPTTVVVHTGLPPEVTEMVDEDGAAELEAGEAS